MRLQVPNPFSITPGSLNRVVCRVGIIRDGVAESERHAHSFRCTYSTTPRAQLPIVTFYQYHICPFCHKAKAVLSYAGLDYESIEVNPLTKKELKELPGDYRKVPIAKVDGEQVNGSDSIIEAVLSKPSVSEVLESRWKKSSPENQVMSMEEFRFSQSSTFWSKYASDELAALLYPNICRSLGESYTAFEYVRDVGSFSSFQKVAIRGLGSIAMYMAASKVKSKRGIVDEREALEQCLTTWEEKGLKSGAIEFSSGKNIPDVGDLSIFGTLRSIQGLPAHTELVVNREGATKEWYSRMNLLVYGVEI